jgi:hypothetical protein
LGVSTFLLKRLLSECCHPSRAQAQDVHEMAYVSIFMHVQC